MSPTHNLSMQMIQFFVMFMLAVNRVTGSFEQMDAFTSSSLVVKSINIVVLLFACVVL